MQCFPESRPERRRECSILKGATGEPKVAVCEMAIGLMSAINDETRRFHMPCPLPRALNFWTRSTILRAATAS